MLRAGLDKVHRDLILGHSLKGMDRYYMAPSEDDLARAMERFTAWLDNEFAFSEQDSEQQGRATNF